MKNYPKLKLTVWEKVTQNDLWVDCREKVSVIRHKKWSLTWKQREEHVNWLRLQQIRGSGVRPPRMTSAPVCRPPGWLRLQFADPPGWLRLRFADPRVDFSSGLQTPRADFGSSLQTPGLTSAPVCSGEDSRSGTQFPHVECTYW